MKRIEALKNELLRRQKDQKMTLAEKEAFLNDFMNSKKQENLNISKTQADEAESKFEIEKREREEARKIRERRLEILRA